METIPQGTVRVGPGGLDQPAGITSEIRRTFDKLEFDSRTPEETRKAALRFVCAWLELFLDIDSYELTKAYDVFVTVEDVDGETFRCYDADFMLVNSLHEVVSSTIPTSLGPNNDDISAVRVTDEERGDGLYDSHEFFIPISNIASISVEYAT